MIPFRELQFPFEHPVKIEPKWKDRCERWYQLDAAAFGLTQACLHWNDLVPNLSAPEFLYIASPGASNETDFSFARTGALSPSKFVHTLPNVRASSLLQVMGWNCPILCLQNDPATTLSALREAGHHCLTKQIRIWVLSFQQDLENQHHYRVFGWIFDPKELSQCNGWIRRKDPPHEGIDVKPCDDAFTRWRLAPHSSFSLGSSLEILYKDT